MHCEALAGCGGGGIGLTFMIFWQAISKRRWTRRGFP